MIAITMVFMRLSRFKNADGECDFHAKLVVSMSGTQNMNVNFLQK